MNDKAIKRTIEPINAKMEDVVGKLIQPAGDKLINNNALLASSTAQPASAAPIVIREKVEFRDCPYNQAKAALNAYINGR